MVLDNPKLLWQVTWKRTAVLTALAVIPLLILTGWRVALGAALGALFILGDIYLLKAPLEMMVNRVASNRRSLMLPLSMLRIIVIGAVLLVLVKFRIANVIGLFVGVTLPIVAMVTVFLTGGLTSWKV